MIEYFEKLEILKGEREQLERESKTLLTPAERTLIERNLINNDHMRRAVIKMIREAQKVEAVNYANTNSES